MESCNPHIGQHASGGGHDRFQCIRCGLHLNGDTPVNEFVWACPECLAVYLYTPSDTIDYGVYPPCCADSLRNWHALDSRFDDKRASWGLGLKPVTAWRPE